MDAAFLQRAAARGNRCALSWVEYISLAGCKGAEAKDGSHFSPKGAAEILARKLEFSVFIITWLLYTSRIDISHNYMNKTIFRCH